jgi:hypothetical protein
MFFSVEVSGLGLIDASLQFCDSVVLRFIAVKHHSTTPAKYQHHPAVDGQRLSQKPRVHTAVAAIPRVGAWAFAWAPTGAC